MKATIEIPQPPETLPCTYPKNAVTTYVKNWLWVQINTVPEEAIVKKTFNQLNK